MIAKEQVVLKNVPEPCIPLPKTMPSLSDGEYKLRLNKVLQAMEGRGYEALILYADREHFSNFHYLIGFEPRFEEGILILRADGTLSLLLGNECLPMHKYSRLPVKAILYQVLSLPNQPIDKLKDLKDILREEGISKGTKTGIVGWKLMYPRYGTPQTFDVPAYLVDAVYEAAGKENVSNATDLFIEPDYGVRILHTAEELALFEYGAAYASESVRRMVAGLRTGMTEMELSQLMCSGGLEVNCHTLIATGERKAMGMVSPTDVVIRLGDEFNCSQGHRGGLSCRTGYVAYSEEDLPGKAKDYMEKLAAPYYMTVANWYEHMRIGATGGEIYEMVQSIFPKETYGWVLNPGHYGATEEWGSSPIYAGSEITIKSGMCFQMDIIPSMEGYAGANCEDALIIADEDLRRELQESYPEVYQRMEQRRAVMVDTLGIRLPREVLPLSNTAGIYRPFLLNKDKAFVIEQ